MTLTTFSPVRFFIFLGGLNVALTLLPSPLAAQKPITLEDIWQNGTFQAKGIPGFNFQLDGVHYTRLSPDRSKVEQYDLRTGEVSGLVFDAKHVSNPPTGWTGEFDGYQFNADESLLLLTTQTESMYRWSSASHFFIFDTKKNTLSRLHDGPKQRYATCSPDGSRVAFVANNDLYIKDLGTKNLTRVTTDGRINAIINGASDWVYEEEFELVRAFEWSPDSKRLAYLRFDESQVPEMTMEMYRDSAYPELVTFKYPKVGEKNADVTAHIFDLESQKTLRVETGADPDDYFPRLTWTPGGALCLTRLNRHQNHLRLLVCDPMGQCRTLLEETSKYYLDLHEPHFRPDGSFVWQSPRSGYDHLYLHDAKGKQVTALTSGDYDVTAFYGVDEKNGLVYYQAASVNAMQREVFSVNLKGKKRNQLSSAEPRNPPGFGYHGAQFSSTFDYWVNSFSTLNSPPQYAVRDRKGKIIRQLEQNDALRAKQTEYGTVPVEFFQTNGTAQPLNGWMMRPANVPEGTQLPVLMFVYGGPGSQQVLDQWKGANYWWFQMLVQQGYVVACVDNRGTGARGDEFKKMTYLQLGKLETEDQIASAQYLGTLPFVDKNRIGIFGWSYGGYMSSLALLKGKEVFEAAIAVAPVTNWKWYDSAYTERYMRTHAENPTGYEDNSPTNFADQLEGKYLLVHGLADDNVHFQHSAEMANQLIAKNKQFDAMLYPNRNHGIGDKAARLHLYRLMTNFLNENLKGAEKSAKP
jgi:dipeptidyl-peptidase 4